jgi:diaminohydroxyphosphoribosylaminopyrimidine deaminase / 5-amino-6-(5-phosphoribosylamino)uracil reductase
MPDMQTDDERFMRMALELAQLGRGSVEPNPMVGAILVRDGQELGRGWHREFGGPHAEVEALAATREAGHDPRGATIYVTLEPCCHQGKTPPCTEALIEAGVARVVVAMTDPDARVSGQGLKQLQDAGVEVTEGVHEADARRLLAPYIKLRSRRRPWVICKWAQTTDGHIALPEGAGRWISGEAARAYVHELRSLCEGILVGIATVVADDPLLTNRSGRGGQPVRVVLDSRLQIPQHCRLMQTTRTAPLLVATTRSGAAANPQGVEELRGAGAEVLELPGGKSGVDLEALLEELGRREWTRLLVEGGARVLESFIYSGMADELLAFVAPRKLKVPAAGKGNLPRFDIERVRSDLSLETARPLPLGDDTLLRFLLTQ